MDSELSVDKKDEVSIRKGSCERILAELLTQLSHPARKFGA